MDQISVRDAVMVLSLLFSVSAIAAVDRWRRAGRVASALSRVFRRFCAKRWRALLAAGILLLSIRAVLLPVWPKPVPAIYDEFSYLLMADTFTLGRLTNPSPPAWRSFETEFVQVRPTYQSVYPVMQGILLAAGLALFGHPWWGVWLGMGFFAAALCWMLQAWLPRHWALAGALLGAAQFGLATYWMNSYWGGAMAATGGALLLGASRRLERGPGGAARYAVVYAAGLVILANSRPLEGFLLAVVVTLVLVWRCRKRGFTFRTLLPGVALLVVCGAGMMFYFWRVTGHPLRMPYQVAWEQYAAGGMFFWSPPRDPGYNNLQLERFYKLLAALGPAQYTTIPGFLRMSAEKLYRIAGFYVGPVLFGVLVALPAMARSRKTAPLIGAIAVVFVALFAVVHLQEHYAAPIASALVLLSVMTLRRFWMWGRIARLRGSRMHFGTLASVALWTLSFAYAAVSVYEAAAQNLPVPVRNQVLSRLTSAGGKHLVLVSYRDDRPPSASEWIYNDADLNGAAVVWARDLGAERNGQLLVAFPDRTVWCVDPDRQPVTVDKCLR